MHVFNHFAGGEEGSGPRQHFAAQSKVMSAQLAEQRRAGSKSCTLEVCVITASPLLPSPWLINRCYTVKDNGQQHDQSHHTH